MTLEELILQFRTLADDNLSPPFWSDETLTQWFNEAVEEACIRARLIHESDDTDVCLIAVAAGTATYTLHDSLYEITNLSFLPTGGTRRMLYLISTEVLDHNEPDWRTKTGTPAYGIQDDTRIRLVPTPDEAGTLMLEGFRLPLAPMALDDDVPEINKAHHRHLVHWVLHKAYAIPDSEIFDQGKSERAEMDFIRYFGMRPDVDLRRITRHDVPHHNEPWDW